MRIVTAFTRRLGLNLSCCRVVEYVGRVLTVDVDHKIMSKISTLEKQSSVPALRLMPPTALLPEMERLTEHFPEAKVERFLIETSTRGRYELDSGLTSRRASKIHCIYKAARLHLHSSSSGSAWAARSSRSIPPLCKTHRACVQCPSLYRNFDAWRPHTP
jgi:hypothetical protein